MPGISLGVQSSIKDLLEPFVGWRLCHRYIVGIDGHFIFDASWLAGVLIFQCLRQRHSVCTHGTYTWRVPPEEEALMSFRWGGSESQQVEAVQVSARRRQARREFCAR